MEYATASFKMSRYKIYYSPMRFFDSPYNNRFARILLAVTPFAFAKVAPVPLKVSGFHPQPSRLREPHNRALYGRGNE
jgi:hypothetical protein